MRVLLVLVLCTVCISCQRTQQNRASFVLSITDEYLTFPIDEETKLPHRVFVFDCNGKSYLSFLNNWEELLFYEVETGRLITKVKYNTKGGYDNVHNILSYMVVDFDNIYLSSEVGNKVFLTDTTARIKRSFSFPKSSSGAPLLPSLYPSTIVNGKQYFHQGINLRLGKDAMKYSPVGVLVDTLSGKADVTPLKYPNLFSNDELVYCTHGNRNWYCFDGNRFVYSYDILDSLVILNADFSERKSFFAKSQYIQRVTPESNSTWDLNRILKETCENPSYGNIMYDKYRQVYYRIVYPKVEFDRSEDFLSIFREGRKQISIMILDKDLNVVGETLFPAYTYNSNLAFVDEQGLYLSVSHYKRSDFDENFLRFQRIELVENSQRD